MACIKCARSGKGKASAGNMPPSAQHLARSLQRSLPCASPTSPLSPRSFVHNPYSTCRSATRAPPSCPRLTELADACTKGDSDRLHQLLLQTRGGVPQTHDPTPLVLAVIYEHDACALLLIAWGSCLNVRCGPDLETALHVSCARGNVEITKALLEANADHRAVDAHGRSPLLIACLTDQPACASLLLESGADAEQPMAGDNPGATPLYAAACAGSQPAMETLLHRSQRVTTPLTAK